MLRFSVVQTNEIKARFFACHDERTTDMALDSSRDSSKRKPTRRTTRRSTSSADSHYSKLTRKSGATPIASRPTAQASQQPRGQASQGARQQDGASEGREATARRATNYESLTSGSKSRVYGKRGQKKRQQGPGNASSLLIAIVFIACLIASGAFFWTHRKVSLTVNGQTAKIRVNSSLDDLHSSLKIKTNPGNYVSVSGNVIEQGKGYPYSAVLAGETLTQEQVEEYRIKGGENLEILDGGDRMEAHEVSYREVQPKLVFQGSWGSVAYVKQWGKVGRQEILTGKDSGETAEGQWVDELKDCVVVYKNVNPADGKQLVALTFDDGPAYTYTQAYLDILEEKGVKATFFNLSLNEQDYPDLAKKVVDGGHQIVSHTNQHLDLNSLDQTSLINEITSARDTIKEITGVETTMIRPPYGNFNGDCWLKSQGEVSVSVLWTQDTEDWSLPGAEVIVEKALEGISSGSIILMHDGGGNRDQDIEALPQIIDQLQNRGYTFVTVSELLASDPEIPEEIAAGNVTMPSDAVWPTEIGEAANEVG